jgi:hypothetical protein
MNIRGVIILMLATGPLALGAQLAPSERPRVAGVEGLLKELTAMADRQLKERADTVAVIHDEAAARARQSEVRARILSLIGGLPDYRGPLNARVTKTTKPEGVATDHVLRESLPDYYVTANL